MHKRSRGFSFTPALKPIPDDFNIMTTFRAPQPTGNKRPTIMNLYDWDDMAGSGLCIPGSGDGSNGCSGDETTDITPLLATEGNNAVDHHYYQVNQDDHQFHLQPDLRVQPEDFHVPNLHLPPSALEDMPVGTPLLRNSLEDPESPLTWSATSSTYSSCPPTPCLEDHVGSSREQSPTRDGDDADVGTQFTPWLSRYEEESPVSIAPKKMFSVGGERMLAGLCFLPPLVIKVSTDPVTTTTTTRPEPNRSRTKPDSSCGKVSVPREQGQPNARSGRSASPSAANSNPAATHPRSCAREPLVRSQQPCLRGSIDTTCSRSVHTGKPEPQTTRKPGMGSSSNPKQSSLAAPAEDRGRTRSKSLSIKTNVPSAATQARGRVASSGRQAGTGGGPGVGAGTGAAVGTGMAARQRSVSRARRSSRLSL